jgi:uncharacterized protein YjiS (DUF1127 family)
VTRAIRLSDAIAAIHEYDLQTKAIAGRWEPTERRAVIKGVRQIFDSGEDLHPVQRRFLQIALLQLTADALEDVAAGRVPGQISGTEKRLAAVVAAYLNGSVAEDTTRSGMASANAIGTVLFGRPSKDPVTAGARWLSRVRSRDDLSPFSRDLIRLLPLEAGRPSRLKLIRA